MFTEIALPAYSVVMTLVAVLLWWQAQSFHRDIPPEQSPNQNSGQNPIDEQLLTRLLPLLIQYKTVTKLTAAQPNLSAQQIMPLFTVLDTLVDYWQLIPIGAPWEVVPFDPQFHQPDCADMQKGEAVYVRFVGYRSGDKILAPAKVSRQLPCSGAEGH